MKRDVFPGPIGHSDSPRLVSSGAQAVATAAQLLPAANSILVPCSLGKIELKPGTIWNSNRMLIYASPFSVYYSQGDQLYEYDPLNFVRESWPDHLTHGASRLPIIFLMEAETATLSSLLILWHRLLGLDIAEIALFYHIHRSVTDAALQLVPIMLRLLTECRYHYAKLFDPLPAQTMAGSIVTQLTPQISRQEIVFFIASAIKDPAKSPSMKLGAVRHIILLSILYVEKLTEALIALTYAVATLLAIKATLLIFLPPAGMLMPTYNYEELKEQMIKDYGKEFANQLREEGYDLSQDEAAEILKQLIEDTGTLLRFRDLAALLSNVTTLLQQLHAALYHRS
ncbi:MAG: hypothetical protein AB1489_01915 [Acidobacteriota bacterium]